MSHQPLPPHQSAEIPELFRYRPWQIWDPVPPWLLRILDDRVLRELAVVQLEAQRSALDVQAKSIDRTLGVLKGGK